MTPRKKSNPPPAPGSTGIPGGDPADHAEPNESPMPWAMDQSLDAQLGLDASHGVAPGKSRISQGAMLLLLVLAVAGVALFIMRQAGNRRTSAAASSVEQKIEVALAQLSGKHPAPAGIDAAFMNTDQVIARFSEDPAASQVDLNHVRKNPFAMTTVVRASSDQPATTISIEDRKKQQQIQQIRSEFNKLSLQSVMQGRTPLAVISNKVVRTGDMVGSFRVVAIEPRSVTLTADGNTYQLTMQPPLLGGQQSNDAP